MGVYSQNRTSLAEGSMIDVVALEGYNGISGANLAMLEGIQDDQAMFEAVIANDFALAEATIANSKEEGVVTEAQIEAITEGTFQTIVDKIKALLEKLMGTVAGITKTFTAKLAGLLIRDNKTLVAALKKRINKTDYSKFEAKWVKAKKDPDAGIVKTACDGFLKYYEDAGKVTTKAALSEKKDGLNDKIENIYGAVANCGSCTASEFKDKLHDAMFEKEESDVKGMSDISAAMNKLVNYKKDIDAIKNAEKEIRKAASKMVSEAKKATKTASSDVEEGKELSPAMVAQLKYDIAAAYRTAVLNVFKGLMTEIKFGIKQNRSVVVKAASYTPGAKKATNESVEYFEALTEASDFEVDTTFDEPGVDYSASEE